MAVPCLHCVVLVMFHIGHVENFEPLQELKIALKFPFYKLLNRNGLNKTNQHVMKYRH